MRPPPFLFSSFAHQSCSSRMHRDPATAPAQRCCNDVVRRPPPRTNPLENSSASLHMMSYQKPSHVDPHHPPILPRPSTPALTDLRLEKIGEELKEPKEKNLEPIESGADSKCLASIPLYEHKTRAMSRHLWVEETWIKSANNLLGGPLGRAQHKAAAAQARAACANGPGVSCRRRTSMST